MQQLNPSEISDIIKRRIESLDVRAEAQNEGTIVGVSDGIVRVHGLAEAKFSEMIEFTGGLYGMVMNLERDSVGVVVLGDYTSLSEGMKARCTGRILEVPVGPALLGRVVDALGNPIDGKGPISTELYSPIEKVAPGRNLPPVGQPTRADRAEDDRRDGADRPRSARIDHRRPPDRQDRHRDRRDHQPEIQRHQMHLRCHRPEDVDGREHRADARGARRDGIHHRRHGERLRPGADAVHRSVLRLRDGRVLP